MPDIYKMYWITLTHEYACPWPHYQNPYAQVNLVSSKWNYVMLNGDPHHPGTPDLYFFPMTFVIMEEVPHLTFGLGVGHSVHICTLSSVVKKRILQ